MISECLDKEAENCVLSMFLKGNEKVNAKISLFNKDYFTGLNRVFFDLGRKILEDNLIPDELVLDDYIRKTLNPVPDTYKGLMQLVELNGLTATTANFDFYADRIKNAWEKREMKALGQRILEGIDKGEQSLEDLRAQIVSDSVKIDTDSMSACMSMSEAIRLLSSDIEQKARPDYMKEGLDIGFPTIDEMTDGFQKGSLNLVGARPSHGKTALALSMFRNVINKGIPAGFISLEMPVLQLMYRLLAMESGITKGRIFKRLFTQEMLEKMNVKMSALFEKNAFFVDSPNAYLHDVEASARMLVLCKGAKILFIDYAGLISMSSEYARLPEYERASLISKRMKTLARSLNVPVVLLVQLNRDAQGKPATMANIRGSGSYEQDADTIILIQREEKDSGDGDIYGEGGTKRESFFLDLNKNRNGATCSRIPVIFDKKLTLFYEAKKTEGEA